MTFGRNDIGAKWPREKGMSTLTVFMSAIAAQLVPDTSPAMHQALIRLVNR